MTARTVRDVLEAHLELPGDLPRPTATIDAIIRELADVLTTGDVWKTRPVPAEELEPGDVIAAKDGRLHMVTAVRGGREVSVSIRRGDHGGDRTFAHGKVVPTLLTTTDARALDLLERELGATIAGRDVA